MNGWKKTFFTIWGGQAVSVMTSSILQFAVLWHLTETTGSAAVLSLATLAGFIPQAVLGLFVGVYVDRYDRKKIIIGADMFIAAMALIMGGVAFLGVLDVWVIMAVLFARSVGSAFHYPAINAVTPLIAPADHLTKCAGYNETLQTASYLFSPALAAVVYAVWDIEYIVLLDVAGALVASLAVAVVKIPKLTVAHETKRPQVIKEARAGLAELRRHRGFLGLLLLGALFLTMFMPVNALFPLMCMDYFGGTTLHSSIAETAFALGMLGGGVLLSVWGGTKDRIKTMLGAVLLQSLTLTVSGLLPPAMFAAFAVCCVLMGFGGPLYMSMQTALFQARVAPEYLGRVLSLSSSIMSVSSPLGLVISAAFADHVGVNVWFIISGATGFVCLALALAIPSIRECDRDG